MVEQFAAPPINPLISIQPLSTPAPGRDAAGAVPPQLANVPPGTVVEGFVVNRDPTGNPVIRTVLGDILIKSDVFMKTGSEIVFRVDTTQQSHARILTIDGLSPQDYVSSNARPSAADSIAASPMQQSAQAAGLGARAAAAVPLQALLVNNAPLPAASLVNNPLLAAVATATTPIPAALVKLHQGAQLQVKVLQVALPELLTRDAQQADAAAPTATPRPAPGAAPTGAPAVPPKPYGPALAQTQTFTNARTAQVALQQAPVPAAPASPANVQTSPAVPTSPTSPAGQPVVPAASPASATPLPSTNSLLQAGVPTDVLANIVNEAATAAAIQAKVAAAKLPLPGEAAEAVRPNPRPQTPAPAVNTASVQSAPTNASPPPAAQGGIPAHVIGHEADGMAILQTPIGTLKMQLPQPVPVGTALRLELTPTDKPPLPVGTAPLPPEAERSIATLAQHWPALEELLAAAPSADPVLARALAQAMPEIGPKLTSGMLFFVAAAKGGDLRQWIGTKAVAALEEKLPALASRLKGDMAQLQQLLVDSPLQQWNSAMIPMLHQGQLEHARLFCRREQDEAHGTGKQGSEQRFILEVDLSQLGSMQFDGFVRKAPGKTHQFDLFVRSSGPLPESLSHEIRSTFETAIQSTGMRGYLGFQHGSQHFVRPMADAAPRTQSGSQPILA
ncbi:MAG: hypothetical protein DI582_01000 [Azospirillum brasilense]|nr:MAG: hypothetical protein DI582_01000 [Azospirillum brasilense]